MQKTLLAVALLVAFASCDSKSEKKESADVTTNDMAVKRTVNEGVVPDSILIKLSTADSQIQRYHKSVDLGDGDTTTKTAFMLDANVLRDYLNSDPTIAKLDVYIAKTPHEELTLIYVGAIDSSGIYVEKSYTKNPTDTVQYLLNHGIPCPTCERQRVFTPDHSE